MKDLITYEQKLTHDKIDLIKEITDKHRIAIKENKPCDTVIVAHGHILRCLTLRWLDRPLNEPFNLILEAGGTGVLSYSHHNVDERALCLGGAFMVHDD